MNPYPILLLHLDLIIVIKETPPLQLRAWLWTNIRLTLKKSYIAATLQAEGKQAFNIPISSFENEK